ncbi:MAG TPA: hypothetical protein VIK50_17940 [Gemmatimonadaceae bacterium]
MTRRVGTWHEVTAAAGFLVRLGPFLRSPVSADEARRRLETSLATRKASFARFLRRAIHNFPASPYRPLLNSARLTIGDIERLIDQVGVEGTLERLHDAGVHVTLEEFKGLKPLQRPGIELALRSKDFDNPLSAREYETNTGGSGGDARRILIGLDLLEHEALYHAGFYEAHGATSWRAGLWLPAPPGAVGIKSVLIRAKLGASVARWFSQIRPDDVDVRHKAFAAAIRTVARVSGWRFPRPEYTPAAEAGRVAAWLAEGRPHGTICLTTPSAAVRVCGAALERGLDVAGTLFVLVGEPFTEAKARVIAAAGCRAATHYAMVEAGMIGLACRAPAAPDDVHLVSDKIATIQRNRSGAVNGTSTRALFHTSLLAAAPKVMLNVESGDSGVIEERDCGCGVLPGSFRRHLHTIRSYEKLTSEGMHVTGTSLISLVEEVLVRRYGGRPTDWQLVEREEGGLPKVSLVASPAIGALDEREVVRTVLDHLRHRGPGEQLMAEVWENGETLRVVRAEPHVTTAGKIQPLQKL